eukprot:TRINITY_DN24554_c0_g1_i1.p1 TRINITY_DN24554_c0_g1~~TRINITY_DN24554_c0_g1_i1.p1  ORF type:complete len:233 (-),score=26.57 TRINITY_DN24554_c0_g1_i1:547-1245(-)
MRELVQAPTNVDQRVASGAEASTSWSDSETAEFAGTSAVEAETSSRSKRSRLIVDSPSFSPSSEEGEMQRQRPLVVVAILEAQIFGGRAPRAPMPPGAASAPTSASTSSAVADASTSAPATSLSTGVRQRPAEITREEAPPEKRPRTKAPPSSNMAAATQPTGSAPWKSNLQIEPGRLLTVEDHLAGDALVVAAVGRACALPRDMQRLREFDDVTLEVSSMQSTISVSFPQL